MSKNKINPEECHDLSTLDVTVTSPSILSSIAIFCESKGIAFTNKGSAIQLFLPSEEIERDSVYHYLDSQKAEYTLPLFRS